MKNVLEAEHSSSPSGQNSTIYCKKDTNPVQICIAKQNQSITKNYYRSNEKPIAIVISLWTKGCMNKLCSVNSRLFNVSS